MDRLEEGDEEWLAFFPVKGSPEECIRAMEAYAAAGVEEFIRQWFSMGDVEGLERIAEQVLPHFASP